MPKEKVDALILMGGGVKGLAYAGAIQELEKHFEFDTYVGTSAGSIAAVLLAAGYCGDELEEILKAQDFLSFLDGKGLKGIWNLVTKSGLHEGIPFLEWMQKLLHAKIESSLDIPMSDLPRRAVVYATMAGHGHRTYDTIGSNAHVSAQSAVRASMAIPIFFTPEVENRRNAFDGGLLANFAVKLFLEQEAERRPGHPVSFIALYLGSAGPRSIRPASMASDLLSILLSRDDAAVINKYRDRIVIINPSPVRTTDFDLTDTDKTLLLLAGRIAATDFLVRRNIVSKNNVSQTQAERNQSLESLRKEASKNRLRRPRKPLAVIAALAFIVISVALLVPTISGGPYVISLDYDTFQGLSPDEQRSDVSMSGECHPPLTYCLRVDGDGVLPLPRNGIVIGALPGDPQQRAEFIAQEGAPAQELAPPLPAKVTGVWTRLKLMLGGSPAKRIELLKRRFGTNTYQACPDVIRCAPAGSGVRCTVAESGCGD